MTRDHVIAAILSCFPPDSLGARQAMLGPLVDEFLSSIQFVPRGPGEKSKNAVAKIEKRISALKEMLGELPRSLGDDLGRMAMIESLSSELNAIERWKRGAGRPEDLFGRYLANWAIIFFERLTNRSANSRNALEIADELGELFSADSKRSMRNQLEETLRARRKQRARRDKRLTGVGK